MLKRSTAGKSSTSINASARARGDSAPRIALAEHAARRERLQKDLAGASGVVFAGEQSGHHYEPDASFVYLTGITDEPGAAVLFDATSEDPERRIILLLRPLNPEVDRWDGLRDMISASLRQRYGFASVLRTSSLPELLLQAGRRSKRLACLHPFANPNGAVSADLALFRKVTERTVGIGIEDRTALLPMMRAVKSPAEIALIRRAIDATWAGYQAAAPFIRDGAGERRIARALEDAYRDAGASGPAYDSIVGSGIRGTVLHYRANDQATEAGDLLVIDSAARVGGYAADITRTFPIGGTFSSEQRDLYEIVLKAQLASIKAARPGATLTDVNNATRAVFDQQQMGDYYIHGIGHHLGLQVHDANPMTKLAPGMVITIEPGLYVPEKKMGVRIEDDILITRGGNENLSAMVPKSVREVEAFLRG